MIGSAVLERRPAAPSHIVARPRRAGNRLSAQVVIDARAAARREVGGVERVAIEMAARLPRLNPGRYAVAKPPTALAYRAGHLWEQALLPAAARRARLLYCPANLAPVASGRTVVVINDLAALRHPAWYSPAYAAYQKQVLPLLARRARKILVPSEFSRDELMDVLGLDSGRIAVVPHGVDPRFTPAAEVEPVLRTYGLEQPYVLVVGTRIARKNLTALARAQARLAEEGIELVSAGSGRTYMRPGVTPPLRALGYIDDDALPGLYAGALALAMPSLYEGFGLPVLEAMASGVPVVAANRTALPETCGHAALLLDPDDGAALGEALLRAAGDRELRERLVRSGLERAAHFSWERSAELTDAAIGEVLEQDEREDPGRGRASRRSLRLRRPLGFRRALDRHRGYTDRPVAKNGAR